MNDELNNNQENFNIHKVQNTVKRIPKQELLMIKVSEPTQISLFQEQQIVETKSHTSTMRIRNDILKRSKKLASANKIKNHGKLMNALLDEVLLKLGF